MIRITMQIAGDYRPSQFTVAWAKTSRVDGGSLIRVEMSNGDVFLGSNVLIESDTDQSRMPIHRPNVIDVLAGLAAAAELAADEEDAERFDGMA